MTRTALFLRWPAALLVVSLLTLSGCGGGEDSSPATTTVAPPVAVSAQGDDSLWAARRQWWPPPAVVVPPEDAEVTGPGELKTATQVNTLPLNAIATAVLALDNKLYPPTPRYAVVSYRLTYVTKDGQGQDIIASGLVSVPVKISGARSPVISYQHGSIFIHREPLALNEFGLHVLQIVVIEVELALERPIRHALTLTEHSNHLIEDGVKVHRGSSCTGGGQYGPAAAYGPQREAIYYMYCKEPAKESRKEGCMTPRHPPLAP